LIQKLITNINFYTVDIVVAKTRQSDSEKKPKIKTAQNISLTETEIDSSNSRQKIYKIKQIIYSIILNRIPDYIHSN